jgi:hypothetical protein
MSARSVELVQLFQKKPSFDGSTSSLGSTLEVQIQLVNGRFQWVFAGLTEPDERRPSGQV